MKTASKLDKRFHYLHINLDIEHKKTDIRSDSNSTISDFVLFDKAGGLFMLLYGHAIDQGIQFEENKSEIKEEIGPAKTNQRLKKSGEIYFV